MMCRCSWHCWRISSPRCCEHVSGIFPVHEEVVSLKLGYHWLEGFGAHRMLFTRCFVSQRWMEANQLSRWFFLVFGLLESNLLAEPRVCKFGAGLPGRQVTDPPKKVYKNVEDGSRVLILNVFPSGGGSGSVPRENPWCFGGIRPWFPRTCWWIGTPGCWRLSNCALVEGEIGKFGGLDW